MNDDVDAPLITLLYTFTHKQLPLSAQLARFLGILLYFYSYLFGSDNTTFVSLAISN